MKTLFDCWKNAPYYSVKWDSYFNVYERILKRFHGKKDMTIVEVGIFQGGSLYMWREYFEQYCENVRIIGIDAFPVSEQLKSDNFEIHQGNQADEGFWDKFWSEVGNVDLLIDDGGHRYDQQIVTVHKALPHINDGGLIIVEDVHTSYYPVAHNYEFDEIWGSASESFIKWAKQEIDPINLRCAEFKKLPGMNERYDTSIFSISFYESMVVFDVNRELAFPSTHLNNGKAFTGAQNAKTPHPDWGKFHMKYFND